MITSRFFLAFFMLFMTQQGTVFAQNKLDLSNCSMVQVNLDQIIIENDGMYLLDSSAENLLPVDGFIRQGDAVYALQIQKSRHSKKILWCGHYCSCKKCCGCYEVKCPNYCPGCP